jgi:hypothetical protein
MDLYLILGQQSQPLFPYLLTKEEAEQRIVESGLNAGIYKVEVPWDCPIQPSKGGRGKSPYPQNMEITTIRVPSDIRHEVKAYAEWRAGVEP